MGLVNDDDDGDAMMLPPHHTTGNVAYLLALCSFFVVSP